MRFKSININAISQLDIRPFPEYRTACATDASGHIAACYLPIQSGSQLWFEYSIDGPHPQNAIYFFRLLFEGQDITSWDCTQKHDYHGKIAYCLHTVKTVTTGERAIIQQSFRFSALDGRISPNPKDDCIEIRVHRAQHRRRLRELPLDYPVPTLDNEKKALRLLENGLIEDHRPARKYQYQLLDPKDTPFATFRFFCRSKDFLQRHQILHLNRSSSLTSTVTSGSQYFDVNTSPETHIDFPRTREKKRNHSPENPDLVQKSTTERDLLLPVTENNISCPSSSTHIPHSASASSVVSRIKDSVEDLPSLVRRVSQSERPAHQHTKTNAEGSCPMSPPLPHTVSQTKLKSQCDNVGRFSEARENPMYLAAQMPTRLPRQLHKRRKSGIVLDLNDTAFYIEHKTTRPLSPFTSSGFLRRLVSSPEPLTTSVIRTDTSDVHSLASTKQRGITSSNRNNEEQRRKEDVEKSLKSTQAQRGVISLKSFLSRTFERRRAT